MIIRKKGDISTLADAIADEIRNDIINEKYKQGDRLIISEIAEENNVSIIPVREALKTLSEEGFVTAEPYRGTIISKLPVEKIYSMRYIIWEINRFSINLAVEKIDDELIAKLKSEIDKLKNSPHLSYWRKFNVNFWGKLTDLLEIPAIANIFRMYYSYTAFLYQKSLDNISADEFKIEQLYELLDSLKNRDREKALDIFNNRIELMEKLNKRVLDDIETEAALRGSDKK